MPDLFSVLQKRWKFIAGLTLLAAVVALVAALLSPKKFLATTTALPANSLVADKARMFNNNIEQLYSDFGTPDELDRLEGTAMLDTIFIATVKELDLAPHYGFENDGEAFYKASMKLKKESKISRSAYGELKIKVWDKDRNLSAAIANTLYKHLHDLHRHLQNESNVSILATLKKEQDSRLSVFKSLSDSLKAASGSDAELLQAKKSVLLSQLQETEKMIDQYQLAVNTNPQVLLTVESARPPLWHDKPKVLLTVLLSAFAAFALSYLMALFVESRK